MRTKPIGTGPFKFVEFKSNESVKLRAQSRLLAQGAPLLDAIDWRVISNRSTRVLAFVAGEFDMTFSLDLTVALVKDIQSQLPKAICELQPTNNSSNLIVNRDVAPFNDPKIRTALALSLDRSAFNQIITEGKAKIGGVMMPAPEGSWGMPPEVVAELPGYGADVEKNRAEARKIMEGLGYSPSNPLKVKVATRNIPLYRDPAVHPHRSAQEGSRRRASSMPSTPASGSPRSRAATTWWASTSPPRRSTTRTSTSTRTTPAARSATTPSIATPRSRS